MSPPIRDGSGSGIGSIRLGDGSEISEVRTGAGDVLFSGIAIPDSVEYQVNAKELTGYSDGDTVSSWTPTVGVNDMTATGSPEYQSSSINGHPSVVYNASDGEYHTVTLDNSVSETFTVIIVYRHDSANNRADFWGDNSGNFPYTANEQNDDRYNFSAGNTATGGSPTNNPEIAVMRLTGDSNSLLRINGSDIINGDVGSVTSIDSFRLGNRGDASNPLEGPIGFAEVHAGEPSNGLQIREQEVADMFDIAL